MDATAATPFEAMDDDRLSVHCAEVVEYRPVPLTLLAAVGGMDARAIRRIREADPESCWDAIDDEPDPDAEIRSLMIPDYAGSMLRETRRRWGPRAS